MSDWSINTIDASEIQVTAPNPHRNDQNDFSRLQRMREELHQFFQSQSQLRYLDTLSWYHPFVMFLGPFPLQAELQPLATLATLSVLEWNIESESPQDVPRRRFTILVSYERASKNVFRYCATYGFCGLFAGLSYWVVGKSVEKYAEILIKSSFKLSRRSLSDQLLTKAGIYLIAYPFHVMAIETFLELVIPSLRTPELKQILTFPAQDIVRRYYLGVTVNTLMSILSFAANQTMLLIESQCVDTIFEDSTPAKVVLYFGIIFIDFQLFVIGRRYLIRRILQNSSLDNSPRRIENEPTIFGDMFEIVVDTLMPVVDFVEDIIDLADWVFAYYNKP